MAITNTEMLVSKFNYHAATKEPESYVSAMEGIIQIFANQVARGLKTEEEIEDFGEMISIANYIGNPINSKSYQKINSYYKNLIEYSIQNNQLNMENEGSYSRVA